MGPGFFAQVEGHQIQPEHLGPQRQRSDLGGRRARQADAAEPAHDGLQIAEQVAGLVVPGTIIVGQQGAQLLAHADTEATKWLVLQGGRNVQSRQRVGDLQAQRLRQLHALIGQREDARQALELAFVERQHLGPREALRPLGHGRDDLRIAIAIAADPAAKDHRRRQRRPLAVVGLDRPLDLVDQPGNHRPEDGGQVDQAAARFVLDAGTRVVQLGGPPQERHPGLQVLARAAGTLPKVIQSEGDIGQVTTDGPAAGLRGVGSERQVQPQRRQES